LAYSIAFKKSVTRDLKRIGKQDAKRILDGIDVDLAENPERFPALTGQFAGLRKYRVGDYRVIFAVMDDEVLILRVQHRKDVCRQGA
jgi:mRNA interferase RelE/StbE